MQDCVHPSVHADDVARQLSELAFQLGLVVPSGPPEMMAISSRHWLSLLSRVSGVRTRTAHFLPIGKRATVTPPRLSLAD